MAGGGAHRSDHDLFAADTSNFLLGIPFEADSSQMEGLASTSTDRNWTIHVYTKNNPMLNTGNIATTIVKNVIASQCIYSDVYDWNLIMMSIDQPIPNRCYSMQAVLNG
jgi:hypothetical protein